MTDATLYRRLFVHRSDVYAQQNEEGGYTPVKAELTDADIARHLDGAASYGVYVIEPAEGVAAADGVRLPVYPANTVRYLVFDLDTYDVDALDYLCRNVERLVPQNPKCLLLEDSGGKGYHLWLLLSEPIAAARARGFAEPVARRYASMRRTATDWPPLEVFPKQDEVAAGAYGNLVKLPFGVHAKTHARAFVVPARGFASSLEDVVPLDVSTLDVTADYKPERRDTRSSVAAPFACIAKLLDDGAGQGVRDDAMYHFASYAMTQGVPETLAVDWCLLVNERFHPPMSEPNVRKCVRSAFARTERVSCRADWLRDFCPGGDRCYAPWNTRSPGAPATPEAATQLNREQRKALRDKEGK